MDRYINVHTYMYIYIYTYIYTYVEFTENLAPLCWKGPGTRPRVHREARQAANTRTALMPALEIEGQGVAYAP